MSFCDLVSKMFSCCDSRLKLELNCGNVLKKLCPSGGCQSGRGQVSPGINFDCDAFTALKNVAFTDKTTSTEARIKPHVSESCSCGLNTDTNSDSTVHLTLLNPLYQYYYDFSLIFLHVCMF